MCISRDQFRCILFRFDPRTRTVRVYTLTKTLTKTSFGPETMSIIYSCAE